MLVLTLSKCYLDLESPSYRTEFKDRVKLLKSIIMLYERKFLLYRLSILRLKPIKYIKIREQIKISTKTTSDEN